MMTEEKFNRFVHGVIRDTDPGIPLILLASQLKDHPSNRYSILGTNPDVIIQARNSTVVIEAGDERIEKNINPWRALREIRKEHPGWYMGYLGYDLKNQIEKLSSDNPDYINAPDLFFFRPEKLLVYDHSENRLVQVTGINPEDVRDAANVISDKLKIADLHSVTSESEYMDKIYSAKERIREGDFYEINLSHMIRGIFEGDGFELYNQMRQTGPVPFGAYLRWNGFEVCSASPERFLSREFNRVYSQPIKGTAPRLQSAEEDRESARKLLESEKNRAENLMIVDLVRHDLSKISNPGSIRVPELFQLQSFKTVHQLISTIEGRVEDDIDSVDILKSCFPMGSMTGAPKIRAMKAIEEFEDYRRGIYSGAIGYIKPNHNFDFNVVIRSAILKDGDLFYPVGGAITSDSNPEEELEETYIKARALTMIPELINSMK